MLNQLSLTALFRYLHPTDNALDTQGLLSIPCDVINKVNRYLTRQQCDNKKARPISLLFHREGASSQVSMEAQAEFVLQLNASASLNAISDN